MIVENNEFSLNYPAKFGIPKSKTNLELINFSSSAQAFAYLKAVYFEKDILDDILNFNDFENINRVLKSCQSKDWEKSKFKIMVIANFYKFSQTDLKNNILGLNDEKLVYIGKSNYWDAVSDKSLANLPFTGENKMNDVIKSIQKMLIPKDHLNHVY